MPGALILVSVGRTRVDRAGLRIPVALLLSGITWAVLVLLLDTSTSWSDLFAGGLILVTMGFVVYSAWALIAYGFTISMLMALEEARAPLGLEDWSRRYGDGKGLEAMLEDRLHVLLGFGLVKKDGDAVRISGSFAKWFASAVRLGTRVFLGPERDA